MKSLRAILVAAPRAALLVSIATQLLWLPSTHANEPSWPTRVLVTNDNGIDDPGMTELARALAEVAETWVVAPAQDRSGTTNLMSAARSRTFHVERRDLGESIEAYALEGYPADCVVFAATGPMRDRLPDLVVSGINGGPNLGDDWFGSGTIGAARTAAYFGLPAIAVSGLDDDDLDAVQAVVGWVVDLARSDAVRNLRPPQYLTVSVPRVHPSEIDGFVIASRARGLMSGVATPAAGDSKKARQTWHLEVSVDPAKASEGSDVAAAMRNRIAIVPMRVDESDPELAAALHTRREALPSWSPPATANRKCRSGLGVAIDDAEDASGDEWGVLIEETLAGGKAEQVGLRPNDVIVAVNGIPLARTGRAASESPVQLIQKLLGELDCGDTVTLDYVRDADRAQVRFEISVAKN